VSGRKNKTAPGKKKATLKMATQSPKKTACFDPPKREEERPSWGDNLGREQDALA